MDDREILWGLYEDVVAQGRHHEAQRLGMTNSVLVVAAAVLAFVGLDQEISKSDAPAGAFLVVLGGMGAVFSVKQYERFRYHMAQARQYRRALGVGVLDELRSTARSSHEQKWDRGWRKVVYSTHLHMWWAGLHLTVSVLGSVVMFFALTS